MCGSNLFSPIFISFRSNILLIMFVHVIVRSLFVGGVSSGGSLLKYATLPFRKGVIFIYFVSSRRNDLITHCIPSWLLSNLSDMRSYPVDLDKSANKY